MITILAADIGATHSRFAIFTSDTDKAGSPLLHLEAELWFRGAEYASFLSLLRKIVTSDESIFASLALRADIAVLAPAGPIQGEICHMSNLNWRIDAQEVREVFGLSQVMLINDFAAQAHACLMPEEVDALPLLPGVSSDKHPIGVIGAGTGLGKALILDKAATALAPDMPREARLARFLHARILSSEGGHEEFPFVGAEEFAFARFVADRLKTDRVIGDHIVTGSGLAQLFAFHTGKDMAPTEVTAKIDESPQTLEWFARFYARACRNYVLDTLALGGLYVAGGMALRIPVLEHPAFAKEFMESATQRELLKDVPVWHVKKHQAGLWGAALYGLLQLC